MTEQPKKMNYCLLKMGYTSDGVEHRQCFTIDEWNIRMLVGEFKILLDKNERGIKLTPQELGEQRLMIKKWEEDLYDRT